MIDNTRFWMSFLNEFPNDGFWMGSWTTSFEQVFWMSSEWVPKWWVLNGFLNDKFWTGSWTTSCWTTGSEWILEWSSKRIPEWSVDWISERVVQWVPEQVLMNVWWAVELVGAPNGGSGKAARCRPSCTFWQKLLKRNWGSLTKTVTVFYKDSYYHCGHTHIQGVTPHINYPLCTCVKVNNDERRTIECFHCVMKVNTQKVKNKLSMEC